MKDNFDVHKWNLNRYKQELNEIDIDDYTDKNVNSDEENTSYNITRGGDDPKMGAELESDSDVVGEAEEKEYEVGYWIYRNDDYDDDYVTVMAKSEEEALAKAKEENYRGKDFKIYKR